MPGLSMQGDSETLLPRLLVLLLPLSRLQPSSRPFVEDPQEALMALPEERRKGLY